MSQESPHRAREVAALTDPTAPSVKRTPSRRPWLDRWMALLRIIGGIQAWILLSLFYVVIVTPMGLLVRWLSDPLRLRCSDTTWQPFARQYDQIGKAQEQS